MPRPKPRSTPLNAPEYADRVNLIKKIKVDNAWRFAPVVPEANGRLKDKVRINGQIETHPEGAYYIEWRERGKRCRVSVAREDAIAEARRKAVELRAIRDGLIVGPEPEPEVAPKTKIGDAIDAYLALRADAAQATHSSHLSLHPRYAPARFLQEKVRRRRDARRCA